MKTLTLLFTTLLTLTATALLAQIDPEVKTLNKSLQPYPQTIHHTFRPVLDSVSHDFTNGMRDDTALYYNIKGARFGRSADSNIRLVYFLHGLGGTQQSWLASHDALDHLYSYHAERPFYNTGSYTNQRDFKNASSEAHKSFSYYENYYLTHYDFADTVFKEKKPYVIGHSQGGLVARDLERRLHEGFGILDSNDRKYWGIITFGTPHAGSYFAVRQDQLARLGSELTSVLIAENLKSSISTLALKVPIFGGLIGAQGEKISDLIGEIHEDQLIDKLFNLAAKDNRDPITKQYGPNSTFLLDTLNQYIDPKMPKGLFYGVEEDPLIWRLVYYMITEDPGSMPKFSANDDSKLTTNMEDLRLKSLANVSIHRGHANYHRAIRNRYLALTPLSPVFAVLALNENFKVTNQSNISEANGNIAVYLSKVNMLYKTILGSYENGNTVTRLVGYDCKKMTVIRRKPIFGGNNSSSWPVYALTTEISHRVGTAGSCPSNYSQNYKVNNRWRRREISYTRVPVYTTTLVETPSDAVVLKPSQMAFPGCLDRYKRPLNEKYDPVLGIIPVGKSKVNHMQMRNCEETEAAMMRIYEADNTYMDRFFKLVKK